jgi:sensor histidine kinase YesM
MLTYLGDLLRISLERMNVPEVPLRDDIAFIDRYLLIEQTRMGDRMQVTQDFQSDTLDAMVPCMILQPILENAIRHGISPHIRTGVIAVSSRRDGDRLILQVEDNGNGLDGSIEERLTKGLGIKNTTERLTHLYNNNQSIRFTPTPGGGLTVTLSLPFRIQSE